MHGSGTKLGITPNKAGARILDLTRLISRAGRVPTGVDRVELAYLRRFVADPVPCFGLVRTAWGYALLDRAGTGALLDRFEGRSAWGPRDAMARLAPRAPRNKQRAESDVRRLAIARTTRRGLAGLIGRHVPQDCIYYNVGHSNLSD